MREMQALVRYTEAFQRAAGRMTFKLRCCLIWLVRVPQVGMREMQALVRCTEAFQSQGASCSFEACLLGVLGSIARDSPSQPWKEGAARVLSLLSVQ